MQINHPADRLLVVARVEDVLRGSILNHLQLALILMDLHLDFIDFVEASLMLEFEDLSIVFPDFFS